MSVRKELLERELNKLGFRRRGASASAANDGSVGQQQQQPQGSSHAQAAQADKSGGPPQ